MPNEEEAEMTPGRHKATLRRLSSLPLGCFSWRVPDSHSEPFVYEGDYAVFDERKKLPVTGGIFLVVGSTDHEWLVETSSELGRLEHKDGKTFWRLGVGKQRRAWWIGAPGRPRTPDEIDQWRRSGRPIPLSDGPMERTHLASMIQGRLIGVLVGDEAITQARVRNAAKQAKLDARARAEADRFDAALYVEMMDRTGSVACIQTDGKTSMIFTTFVQGMGSDRSRIYEECADNFRAHARGGRYSDDKLDEYLRQAHRIITVTSSGWRYDADFPPTIRELLDTQLERRTRRVN